jgi:hypothetical protein
VILAKLELTGQDGEKISEKCDCLAGFTEIILRQLEKVYKKLISESH